MLQRVFSCKQKHCIEQVTGIWERVRNGYRKCKSKMDRQDNTTSKWNRKYKRTITYQALHRKLTIKQHQPPLQSGAEHRCPGRVSGSCCTRRVILVTSPVINLEWRKDRKLWLRQTDHIRDNLWYRYSVAVN